MSDLIHRLETWQSLVFLLNSCYPRFRATFKSYRFKRSPFFLSYGVILPSSLRMVLSITLVDFYSPTSGGLQYGFFLLVFPVHLIFFLFSPTKKTEISHESSKEFPIELSFRHSLRGRLTLRRFTVRRKPWGFSEHVFHMILRYSYQHSHL